MEIIRYVTFSLKNLLSIFVGLFLHLIRDYPSCCYILEIFLHSKGQTSQSLSCMILPLLTINSLLPIFNLTQGIIGQSELSPRMRANLFVMAVIPPLILRFCNHHPWDLMLQISQKHTEYFLYVQGHLLTDTCKNKISPINSDKNPACLLK